MNIIKIHRILAKYTMFPTTLGTPLRCSSTTAPALSYYRPSIDICIALLPAIHGSICSFWKNLIGPMFNLYWVRFACNHSLCTGSTVVGQCMEQRSGVPNGYALISGILPCTLRARFAHVKSFRRFYRRIGQTTATDGGSVDFAGASHRPDSLTDFIKYLPIVCIPMKYPG